MEILLAGLDSHKNSQFAFPLPHSLHSLHLNMLKVLLVLGRYVYITLMYLLYFHEGTVQLLSTDKNLGELMFCKQLGNLYVEKQLITLRNIKTVLHLLPIFFILQFNIHFLN